MVLGGLVLSFAPGLPDFELPPDLVLVAFLPPLLYSAAFFTSLRDLRTNVKPIGLLAIGLVAATTVSVAAVAHWTVDLPWSAAFVLGAIVSPTDPLAATSIARRLGAPRRIVAIVEGESLVNDATALVLYRVAVVAVTTGAFSLWESGGRLVLNAVAGVAIGLAVGYVVRQVRKRMNDAPSEIAISLLTGYFAYLPAEALGVSAVLAAVTAGIYLGWHTPELTNAQTRIQGFAFWTILIFILNAALFALVGLQLPLGARRTGRVVDRRSSPAELPPSARPSSCAHRLGGRLCVPPAPDPDHAQRPRRLVGRDEGGRLARGRAGDPARDRGRRAVPRPRADHLPRVLRDPLHPGRPRGNAARA